MLKNLVCLSTGTILGLVLLVAGVGSANDATDPERWGDHLDYAYVYSSADSGVLKERLAEYSAAAGLSLDDYVDHFLSDPLAPDAPADEMTLRRRSIAFLLQYLATRDPALIDRATESTIALGLEIDSYESRYIGAQQALERGNMLVSYPTGEQSTLRDALSIAREDVWMR